MAREMNLYEPPAEVADSDVPALCRVDSGVVEGSEISQHYDPMISKLVTYGKVGCIHIWNCLPGRLEAYACTAYSPSDGLRTGPLPSTP